MASGGSEGVDPGADPGAGPVADPTPGPVGGLAAGGGGGSGQAPTVELTSPSDGASFIAPANIAIAATAGDSDNDLDRVNFYNGGSLLFSDSSSPYGYDWQGVPAGSYLVRAVAVDEAGHSTEDTANITVTSSSGCSLAAWSAAAAYAKGSEVQHTGIRWRAKRNNQGIEPGTSPATWSNLGPCTQ